MQPKHRSAIRLSLILLCLLLLSAVLFKHQHQHKAGFLSESFLVADTVAVTAPPADPTAPPAAPAAPAAPADPPPPPQPTVNTNTVTVNNNSSHEPNRASNDRVYYYRDYPRTSLSVFDDAWYGRGFVDHSLRFRYPPLYDGGQTPWESHRYAGGRIREEPTPSTTDVILSRLVQQQQQQQQQNAQVMVAAGVGVAVALSAAFYFASAKRR
jgi:hypothetical protein